MSSESSVINVGVIGFGMSAQVFHAPLISTTKGLHLAAIVNRSGPNLTLSTKYPKATVYQSHDQLFKDSSIDLVVITTPNTLHFDLAREAIEAGKHVIVEKPFTVTFEQGILLAKLAKQHSRILSVFQNRRWDSDFLTIQKLVQAEKSTFGRIVSFESRFDRFRNFSKEGWRETGRVEEGSGVLYDLCSHLLDQALVLFGEPEYVTAHVSNERQLNSSQVDDQFLVHLDYKNGLRCTLGAGMLARIPTPRYRLNGMNGSFIKYGLDVQEGQLKEGLTPNNAGFGVEKEECWGELDSELDIDGVKLHVKAKVESEKGNYSGYYENVYKSIQGNEKLIVTAEQAAWVVHGIELAIKSSRSGRRLSWNHGDTSVSALRRSSNDITSLQNQTRTSFQIRSESAPKNSGVKDQTLASFASTSEFATRSESSPGNGHGHAFVEKEQLSRPVNMTSDSSTMDNGFAVDPTQESSKESVASGFTARFQDHLKLFFSMHHKLFDLVAFYVVMFAINGQMTSLPTRLEWIGFCVQSVIALRRAFQTSIKHGLGLTSFLGMLDLVVGQLFLHQDRLGLLPTVANILVYFYVINLTRGLVFGDSVSCLLWLLFGLVDIYRKDPSSVSILDLTPYKVIPVHTVGFGLYILMSELVDVMLQSSEPDPIQGRYLNYMGSQKETQVSLRSSSRRSTARSTTDASSNLRFELCITEITPFTISFCLNALSDPPQQKDASSEQESVTNNTSTSSSSGNLANASDSVDLSSIKIGSASSTSKQSKGESSPKIISTSDIAIHVNYIPWHQVQYHFPADQTFTVYGLTPSTDYEIEMKVHQFSSFVTRVGTRAAPPGTPIPLTNFERMTKPIEPLPKTNKNRKNKKNQKAQKDTTDKGSDTNKSKSTTASTSTSSSSSISNVSLTASEAIAAASSSSSKSELNTRSSLTLDQATPHSDEQNNSNQAVLEQLQASIQSSTEAAAATRAALKKLKRDQGKSEALLRQELEGIGRGQAKMLVQDQKRKQKLSFLQESIKQADAQSVVLQEELIEMRNTSSQHSLDEVLKAIRTLEKNIQDTRTKAGVKIAPVKSNCQRIQAEIKRLESECLDWSSKASILRESELAPLQLRLQRLEQQQVVWRVAAVASKDKDREANLKIAVLEEEIQKKTQKSRQTEEEIQELEALNLRLRESVERELEIWEGLERDDIDTEFDTEINADENLSSNPLSRPTSHASNQFAMPPLTSFHPDELNNSVDSHIWPLSGNGVSSRLSSNHESIRGLRPRSLLLQSEPSDRSYWESK
ncbi:hypothetical protein BGZ76_000542 [Entomortierella beljakovae]|nr:hypothetical protein BGZ76_000542 [Entomortierella beljakovae]